MNKAELIDNIAEKLNVSKKTVEDVLETMLDTIVAKLKQKEEVTLTSFGTFSARVRSSRMGVNPQNPSEKIEIPEVVVPKFKAGKGLKDALKGKAESTPEPIPTPESTSTPEQPQTQSDNQ